MEGPEIKFAEAVLDNGKFGKRTVRFETGRLAQQAQGAVAAYLDEETMILSATSAGSPVADRLATSEGDSPSGNGCPSAAHWERENNWKRTSTLGAGALPCKGAGRAISTDATNPLFSGDTPGLIGPGVQPVLRPLWL